MIQLIKKEKIDHVKSNGVTWKLVRDPSPIIIVLFVINGVKNCVFAALTISSPPSLLGFCRRSMHAKLIKIMKEIVKLVKWINSTIN